MRQLIIAGLSLAAACFSSSVSARVERIEILSRQPHNLHAAPRRRPLLERQQHWALRSTIGYAASLTVMGDRFQKAR
jgi:hypothetical protein